MTPSCFHCASPLQSYSSEASKPLLKQIEAMAAAAAASQDDARAAEARLNAALREAEERAAAAAGGEQRALQRLAAAEAAAAAAREAAASAATAGAELRARCDTLSQHVSSLESELATVTSSLQAAEAHAASQAKLWKQTQVRRQPGSSRQCMCLQCS